MNKPSINVLKSIIALKINPSWQEIVAWLNESLLKQSVDNNKSMGEATIKMQGRNLELSNLLTYIKKAEEFLENAKETERRERKE